MIEKRTFSIVSAVGCGALLSCGGVAGVVGFFLWRDVTSTPQPVTVGGPIAIASEVAEADAGAEWKALSALVEVRPVPTKDDPIVVAKPRRAKEATPALYAAPLATPPIEFFWRDPEGAPPLRHVTDLVCAGDAGMRRKWLAALDAAAKRGADDFDLGEGYGDLLEEECTSAEFCRFAAASAKTARHPETAEHLWDLASGIACRDRELADVFLATDAPTASVLQWLSWHREPREEVEWNAAWGDALRRHLASGVEPDPDRIFEPITQAAGAFARWKDPRATEALLNAHASAKTKAQKDHLALGMGESHDARLRALHAEACPRYPERCDPSSRRPEERVIVLAEEVRSPWFDVGTFLEKNPGKRAEVIAAARACDDPKEEPTSTCARHLAAVDWAVARAHAAKVAEANEKLPEEERWAAPIDATLLRFESRDALQSWLVERKLLRAPVRPRAGDLTALALLARGGRVAIPADPEDMLSLDHAQVLRRIAAAAAPALDGAVFSQAGSCNPPKGREWTKCELYAWMDGEKWSFDAIAVDDTYDIAMIVAFANALLAARRSELAVVAVEDDSPWSDAGYAALVGPAASVRELVAGGLVTPFVDELAPQPEEEYEDEYEEEDEEEYAEEEPE